MFFINSRVLLFFLIGKTPKNFSSERIIVKESKKLINNSEKNLCFSFNSLKNLRKFHLLIINEKK